MLFSAPAFVFGFLPVAFLGAWLLGRVDMRARTLWLVSCSLFFYGYWKLSYLPILLASIALNFWVSRRIQAALAQGHGAAAQRFMVAGVVGNLSALGFYKYTDFVTRTINQAVGSEIAALGLALPLAISFFTFQQIAYLVDARQGRVGRSSLADYALFVTFFPQLIAGPIVHHSEMMGQFARKARAAFPWPHVYAGLFIFAIGLFKKVVIADTFAVYADQGYAGVADMSFRDAWVTTFSYTLQLYFDFSGYSDMAIGLARMFGIRLPINFYSPYKAVSIAVFWRRWHITLSRFLRDYVYILLGGNRRGPGRTSVNLFATFVLGGIWHGAGWTFIVWGALHGAALVIARACGGVRVPRVLGWAMTFAVVHIGWIFFRADELGQAIDVVQIFLGLDAAANLAPKYVVIAEGSVALRHVALGLLAVLVLPNSVQFARNPRPLWKGLVVGVMLGAGLIGTLVSRSDVFLYFNF